jgi:hypothetical protein
MKSKPVIASETASTYYSKLPIITSAGLRRKVISLPWPNKDLVSKFTKLTGDFVVRVTG